MPTIDDLISKYRGGGQNAAASGQNTAATSIDDLVAKYRPNSPESSAKPEQASSSAPTSMASATQKTEAAGAASTVHKSAAGVPWESKKASDGVSFQQRMAQAEYERKKQSGTATDDERTTAQNRRQSLIDELDQIEANSGYVTDELTANAQAARRQAIVDELHSLDEQLGNPAQAYTQSDRVGSVFGGWAQRRGGNDLNALLTVGRAAGEAQARAQLNSTDQFLVDRMLGEDTRARAQEYEDAIHSDEYNAQWDKAYAVGDRWAEAGNQKLSYAKEGVNGAGRLAIDLGVGALDLAGDAVVNQIAPGAGQVAMASRVFGEAAREQRQKGGSQEQQLLAGTKAAAIEVLTEKIGGPFEKLYGKTLTGKMINKALDGIDNKVIRKALDMASDALGEAAEEMLSDLANPVADYILGLNDEYENFGDVLKDYDWSEILYDGLVGGILGLTGSAAQIMGQGGQLTPEQIEQVKQQAAQAAIKAVDAKVTESMPEAAKESGQTNTEAEEAEDDWFLQAWRKTEEDYDRAHRDGAAQQAAEDADAAQILADIATGQQTQETTQQAEPGNQVDAARLLADLATGQEGKLNIDNAEGIGYTESNETTAPEVTDNGTGRGIEEDRGGVPGVYEGRDSDHPGQGGSDGVSGNSGSELLSPESQNSLKQSGVYVETQASTDNAAFSAALDEARAADANHGWAVTPKSAEELSAAGTRAFVTAEGTAGYAIAKDGDIEAVFANKAKGAPKGVSRSTIPQAIANGGTKLDCYGTGLVRLYSKHGFVPVARVIFNPEYANPGWDPSKGSPDIYFMMYTGQSADEAVQNYGNYPVITQADLDALPVMDYDAAYEYRDSLLEEQNRNRAESRQELADEREGIPAPATISEKFNAGSGALNTTQNAETQTQNEAAPPRGPTETQGAAQNGAQQEQQRGGSETPNGPPTQTESAAPEGMKRSQTESNTLHSMAEERGGEQESLYYVPTTERQTLTAALNRVDADRVGEMQSLMGKEMWNAEDIDTGLSLYGLLKAESLRSGDNSAANAWAKIVQERGTRSGQALQAFSKWTRSAAASAVKAQEQLDTAQQNGEISPEEAQRISNDIYDFAQELDSVEDGDLTSLRELIKRQSDYRGTGTFRESNFMRMLNEVEDFDWLREFATRQLMNMADDVTVTADLGQKLKTWQVNSQLTRLGTFFRNIGGNVVFGVQDTLTQDGLGVALDMLVSKFTGKRAVGVDKSWFSSKARKGAHDAMVRSILEVAGDVDMTGQGNRYGTTASRTFKMSGNGFERFMSRWEQLLGYSLTTSDRVSRGQIETAVQEGLEGFDLTEEERAELGETMADYRLFQNKDTAYKLSKGIHDVLNILGVGGEVNGNGRTGGFGAGDVINPYPGVPANLAVKALEYSPANIVKGSVELFQLWKDVKHDRITTADGKTGEHVSSWTAAQQQKAVMDIARGFSGVPMIVLLTALFKSGLAKNADDEEDPDAAAQKRAEGRTGVQINLDAALRAFNGESAEWKDEDDLLSIGWLEPMNAFMAIASMIAEESGEDATLNSYAKDYFAGTVQSVLEMPVMQNIANAVDTFRYSTAEDLGSKVGETALSLGGDALSGMIPAPVGQTARTIDKNYRDVSSDDPFGQVWNNLRNVIPGLRETLPVKTDNFGNPKEYSGDGMQRFLNNFVLPGAVNEINQTETSAAVERLYEATGDANVYPDRNAPTSFKIGGEQYRMNAEERRTYHNTYGKLVEQYTGELLLGDKYSDLSDAERVELIGNFKQYASYKAKQEYMEAHGEQYADSKWAKVEDLMDSGISLVDALTWKEAANKDGGGLSQAEVYDYLIGSDLSDKQRAAIWGTMNYSGKNAEWADYLAGLAKKK